MNLRRASRAACTLCGLLLFVPSLAAQQSNEPAPARLERITNQLREARATGSGLQDAVLRIYLDEYEPLESLYGGSEAASPQAANAIARGEAAFHAVMSNPSAQNLGALDAQLAEIARVLRGAAAHPVARIRSLPHVYAVVSPARAETPEIRSILQQFQHAAIAYDRDAAQQALTLVEHAYLEGFEPLESRLPRSMVERVEKRIHLELRPAIRNHANAALVKSTIGAIGSDLMTADRFLARGSNTWFAVVNSFVIIVREGLEAVLLIAALLAYLAAIGAQQKHRRQIYAGMSAGVVATVATFFAARTLIPISGANRELLEGVTALIAVGVLLYVAHWLFQKTYIHDWKEYLRSRLGGAVTRGSALAMAMLAFAAVYREGFETVLFYQALSFDAGLAPVLGGFIPGALVITAIGIAIIRMGVKLPLKKVFAGTNAILMYLAFVFIGKGIYNLQEAGVFAPHPWRVPDNVVLRQLFGLYPLAETIVAQGAFLILLGSTYLYYRRRMAQRTFSAPVPQNAPLPAPRAEARQA